MRPVALLSLFVVVACGAPKPPPDPLTREVPVTPVVDPIVADASVPDYRDAGVDLLDGGCCVVPFALAAQAGEVAAMLRFRAGSFDMVLDGGVWRVDACVEPAATEYYYLGGYPADDDAGTVWLDRVNDAVPTSYTSSVAPVVNLFDAPASATCDTLDAGVHAQVPDAG